MREKQKAAKPQNQTCECLSCASCLALSIPAASLHTNRMASEMAPGNSVNGAVEPAYSFSFSIPVIRYTRSVDFCVMHDTGHSSERTSSTVYAISVLPLTICE